MNYLVGVDIGTAGTKTVLFDVQGRTLKSSMVEYPLYQPQNGWAEQNPEDWWQAVVKTLRCVTQDIDPADIKAVGLSGQMHGLVMLDEQNQVIRPAILWCDGRTSEECAEITRRIGAQRLVDLTANPALPGFTAAKIMWIKKYEPENDKKCRHILLPKDYIRFRLTGVYATEVSDASGMQLLDIRNRCWSEEVLEKLNIDKSRLAKVYESPEITGTMTRMAAQVTGLKEGTIVVGGAGDNAAAAVGVGVVTEKTAFTTIGTSGVVYAHTDKMLIDKKGRVHTFCCAVPGKWHVMGVTQAAGLSLKWFRDTCCAQELERGQELHISPYRIMDQLAGQAPVGSNKLLFLSYLMGERTPHLDSDARGGFFGLSASHKKGDLIRAVMEGVCFSLRDCMEVLRELDIVISDMAVCGGGGNSALWRRILADVYSCRIKTLCSTEGPAMGAAILAGVGAKIYPSVEEGCNRVLKVRNVEKPNPEQCKRYEPFYQLYRSLYQSLKQEYQILAKL